MIKSILSIICFLGISFTQIQFEGNPKFYDTRELDLNFLSVDQSQLANRSYHPMVFQFGDEYEFSVDVLENAVSINNNNEISFLLGIESSGAFGIGLYFDQFNLSQNSKLFIYDSNRTYILGALTSKNNKPTGDLATSIVKSDKIILELSVPLNELGQISLHLSSIVHDYTDINNYYNTSQSREDCNTNVVCDDGDDWRDQINGVIRVQMGGGLCSASLINNTANDRTPYVLFADHCVSGNASSYVFDFNYQSSSCNGTTGPTNQSISGSAVLIQEDINSGPDFALLQMNSDVPDSYNPFYVGWSRSSSAPQEAIGIHHPGGDIKKISFTNDNVSAGGTGGYYWEFQYDNGRVIPGSSGSPFFDGNKRQVGIASYIYTNYCDPSPDCYCSQQYDHGYGRFDVAMDMGMSQYLDPLNSGSQTLDGISISGISIDHTPFNDVPFESSELTFSANVSAFSGNIDAVELFYDLGDGMVSEEMVRQNFGNNYQASVRSLFNGMIIDYYILAVNSEGIVETYPANAPTNSILFILGDLPDLYSNNFEEDVEGWVVGDDSDNATAGIWELAEPVATYNDNNILIQPGEDNTSNGTFCFITGNGFESGNGGFDDVDAGKTTLYSPVFDCSGLDEVLLTYWRWYTNNIGDNGDNDKWVVSVSNNNFTWIDIENTSSSNEDWIKKRFLLSNYIDLNSTVSFRFIAEDILYDGDNGSGGSLVEAGLDDFSLEFLSDGSGIIGDVNSDESIDVLDVVLIVNMILGTEDFNYLTADINSDNSINVQDIIALINIILN